MAGKSPTQRSLKHLRDEGITVAVTEHWNAFARKRQDLFGFADLIAFGTDRVALIQVTSYSNMSARVKKILASDIARSWLAGRCRTIIVHGWKKKTNGRYELKERILYLKDFDDEK